MAKAPTPWKSGPSTRWTVDAELGAVSNSQGKRIGSLMVNGYMFLTMTPAVGGRSNQNAYAHRVIWESRHGPIPDGLQVNHMNTPGQGDAARCRSNPRARGTR